ncbi:Cyclic nucleotide-gated potassium channel [Planctomycetes bacterium Poly30]|uniref:Cyclic nucleotide-gated potassium channel n=2 Tax=Saltatorellus ferox TaxID=2528018 RepID=A0A518EP88_9BACT|nr:Cyclic nucleotide-gated potassium channel [Planctomycetes bacterium Poly30]
MPLRRRVHFILEVDRFGDRISRLVDKALVALIVLNVLAAILQTDASIYERAPRAFELFELASMVIFGLEYGLRVWSCVEDHAFAGALNGRLRFAVQPMMLLDLVVLVLPFYLDLRPLRILRLLRLGRYSPRLRLFARVIRDKRDELFVGLFVAVVLLVACSTAMYYVEGPEKPGFQSIPQTMWWGVATLTTVGYGDVYPETGLGKILGAMVALLGVGIFALPAGILASGFSDALSRENAVRADEMRGKSGPSATQSAALAAIAGHAHGTTANTGGTCPTCGTSLSEILIPPSAPPRDP